MEDERNIAEIHVWSIHCHSVSEVIFQHLQWEPELGSLVRLLFGKMSVSTTLLQYTTDFLRDSQIKGVLRLVFTIADI